MYIYIYVYIYMYIYIYICIYIYVYIYICFFLVNFPAWGSFPCYLLHFGANICVLHAFWS